MVNELDVFDALKHLTSVSDSEYRDTVELCRKCLESLKKELKDETDFADPRVIDSAAANAFYLLCIKEKAALKDEIASFKAGDISITQESGNADEKIKSAKELCEQARKRLIPLMEDKGFFAGKVDI